MLVLLAVLAVLDVLAHSTRILGPIPPRSPMEPINLFDLEAIAREKLPRDAYDYYASGAHDEVTLRENRAAYDRLSLAYRVLVDVSRREMATTVLGQPVSSRPPRSTASPAPRASWRPCGPPERRAR